MKPYILVSDGFDKDQFKKLVAMNEFDVYPEPKVAEDKLAEIVKNAHGLVIRSATTVTPALLEGAPNLKLVIRAGEGTDNIDKSACAAKGVKVANTPGANNNSAAEHAIALMMSALRYTPQACAKMKSGGWDKNLYTGLEISNKKIGVVGFGRIGQIVAKRLAGFEPEILFFDPSLKKSDIPYARKATSLEEVFETCDIITLHTPLTAVTKGMIGDKLLSLMKKEAVLVNASRGGIVDEEALYTTLKEGKIRAAAFDVFASEPLPEDSKLRLLENLIMTPHLGASTEEAQVRVGEMVLNQLREFFLNNNLLNEVRI